MTLLTRSKTELPNRLWVAIVAAAFVLSYLLGYIVSSRTGVEPGFFEQPEAGGYGVSAEKSSAPGLDKDLQDYYKDLAE